MNAEVGQIWMQTWNGRNELFLMLDAVDVSLHRMTKNRPEPGFFILSLDHGWTTYLCGDSLDPSFWVRIT